MGKDWERERERRDIEALGDLWRMKGEKTLRETNMERGEESSRETGRQ